jgi:hypothetical protein
METNVWLEAFRIWVYLFLWLQAHQNVLDTSCDLAKEFLCQVVDRHQRLLDIAAAHKRAGSIATNMKKCNRLDE